uniref:Uncharacterized protein n=1 Tax=Lepeophtheirus salmonis TaxID=72036 RepID=A0A0K2TNC8_LEPSM
MKLATMFKKGNYTEKSNRWKLNRKLLQKDDVQKNLKEGVEMIAQDLEAGWNIRKALNKFNTRVKKNLKSVGSRKANARKKKETQISSLLEEGNDTGLLQELDEIMEYKMQGARDRARILNKKINSNNLNLLKLIEKSNGRKKMNEILVNGQKITLPLKIAKHVQDY